MSVAFLLADTKWLIFELAAAKNTMKLEGVKRGAAFSRSRCVAWGHVRDGLDVVVDGGEKFLAEGQSGRSEEFFFRKWR